MMGLYELKEMRELKIAVIGDLHYPRIDYSEENLHNSKFSFYSKFLNAFLEAEADYYVSIGDLTNYGYKDELEDIYQLINQHGKNFIHVLGNHDLYGLTRKEVLDITNMNNNFIIETEQANLLFLDTAREQDLDNCSGYLNEEQLHWFEQEVYKSGEKLLIVFAHHPVYDTTARSNQQNLSIDPILQVWDSLSKKQGQGIYINGHNHLDSIVTKDNWTFIQIAAVLDDQSVRILEIDEDEVNMKPFNLQDQELVEQAQLIGQSIPHFHPSPEGLGTTPNRQTTIVKNNKRWVHN
jgi:3',5'-cyclic-AMP phosphodiesterase